jgi:hypothetical protein
VSRKVTLLTLALLAGAVSIVPSIAVAADTQRPSADTPSGWSAHAGPGGLQYFVPPGATNMDTYEAVFPTQSLTGTLQQTAAAISGAIVGDERVIDTKAKEIRVGDGAPTCEVIVASVDAKNQGIYRVFVVKQYGANVAAGELRFTDVDRIKSIGEGAFASLENMTAADITPYHAGTITPLPPAGVDVGPHQTAVPPALIGTWALKVPGVAYTTSVDYGAFTKDTLHVSPGAAAGYLRITAGKRYVWYDAAGHALSHGRLVQVVPHRDAHAGQTYWRVFEGREEHYITLDGDGGISVYDTGTNMVSMQGSKH